MKTAAALDTAKASPDNGEILALPPEAKVWIGNMRSAFLASAALRRDQDAWEKLEGTASALLARRHDDVSRGDIRATQNLPQEDKSLLARALALLTRADSSGRRAECLNAAAQGIATCKSYADDNATAFSRHAALVWLALWHLSDLRNVLPEDVHECLFKGSESEAGYDAAQAKMERTSHVLAKALKAAASALRKADQTASS